MHFHSTGHDPNWYFLKSRLLCHRRGRRLASLSLKLFWKSVELTFWEQTFCLLAPCVCGSSANTAPHAWEVVGSNPCSCLTSFHLIYFKVESVDGKPIGRKPTALVRTLQPATPGLNSSTHISLVRSQQLGHRSNERLVTVKLQPIFNYSNPKIFLHPVLW